MIDKVFSMIDDFLNDHYDPVKFSWDLPIFVCDNYEIIENENT